MLKCIRCGSPNELRPYRYKTLTGMTKQYREFLPNKKILTYETDEVPVCRKYQKNFDGWIFKKNKTNVNFIVSFMYFLALIIQVSIRKD